MKNKKTASVLALFLGGLGIHRFYLGQTTKGVLSILLCWTIIPWIIGVIDFLIFLYMSQEFFDVKYNQNTQLRCAACDNLLVKNTVSFWKLGKGNPVCKICFQKFRQKGRETGKYEFSEIEVKKIINEEIKNRPLPTSNFLKVSIPNEEILEIDNLPDGIDILQLNTLAFISYKDAQGQKSERRITIKSIYQTHGDYSISAYCHEREAYRTFKLSRINQLTDIENGEIFDNPSEFFLERYNDSPIGQLTNVFQELEHEILVLSFMARADGFLRQKEREIIAKYILNRSNIDLNNEILDKEIRRTYCESSDFRKSLKKISNNPKIDKMKLFNSANEIINSDKKTDPIEIGILELIKKELKIEKASA